jgi:hypothetical protein
VCQLVALLTSRETATQQRAARAIWDLAAKHPGAAVRIVNAGAISHLVALLGAGSLGVKEAAVGALSCLANNNAPNAMAIATGLVALLEPGGSLEVMEMLLTFATDDADNRAAIAKVGAIERLVVILHGSARVSVRAQELAATVLKQLSADCSEHVDAIVRSGGVKPLIALLSSESSIAQASCSHVLADLARTNHTIQTIVAADGAIPPLVALVSTSQDADARAAAAAAIWALSTANASMQASLEAAGAVPPLVTLLEEPSERAQLTAAGALSALALGAPRIQEAIWQGNGLAPLVELLSDGRSHLVHAHAAHGPLLGRTNAQ